MVTRIALIKELQESIQTLAVFANRQEMEEFIRTCKQLNAGSSNSTNAVLGFLSKYQNLVGKVLSKEPEHELFRFDVC